MQLKSMHSKMQKDCWLAVNVVLHFTRLNYIARPVGQATIIVQFS
jgi:hypothetical protein